ncbi:decaprenylphospho-beta-D-erythro-pentofuranosid-2-ulose 2-reductase [Gammaproteobacteria bacterium]
MKRILIIGATSAIAEATARYWANAGHRIYLMARNEERLRVIATDLKIRGATVVDMNLLDANDFEHHTMVIDAAIKIMDGIDIVLIAHGTLGDQKSCEQDFASALRELNTNAISVISLLTHLTNYFEIKKQGTIAVISSVAGDRGRQSNYVYGTAKGAVTIFLQGLRQRLHKSGVNVLTVKPGFVDTPMTKNFKKGLLWASPEEIAQQIATAIEKKKNVVYTPKFWWLIMTIIKAIPESLFKNLHT